MNGHPDRADLRSWLEGNRSDLTGHVESCEHCQQNLESLTDLGIDITAALASVTRPASGFLDRLEAKLSERRRSLDTLGVALGLFSLSWRTLDAMIDDD